VLIKKYGNRRLYDTEQSRYITLEELAELIRRGDRGDVRVVGAKNGEDLTTATLAQIIFESWGAARLLPAPLLVQLIRMGDSALAEFLGTYVSLALDAYRGARKGVQAIAPFTPFLGSGAGLSRLFGRGQPAAAATAPAAPPADPLPEQASRDDVAALRREVEALKVGLKKRRR
jgi:polyhydroxyalkanoate synthesis repressor PhaR